MATDLNHHYDNATNVVGELCGQYGNARQKISADTMMTLPQLLVSSVRIRTLHGIDTAVDFHHHDLAKVVGEERGVHRG